MQFEKSSMTHGDATPNQGTTEHSKNGEIIVCKLWKTFQSPSRTKIDERNILMEIQLPLNMPTYRT